jgi:hypothetical protein
MLTEDQAHELLAHLVTSAELCATEPGYYGTFRLIDAASRLVGALLAGGADDPWLAEVRREIEEKKVLMMSDREAYFAFLPEMSRKVGEHLREREFGSKP